MTVATDKEQKRQDTVLTAALVILQAGPQKNLALARLVGVDGSDMYRILANCPKVRPTNDSRTLTTWELSG